MTLEELVVKMGIDIDADDLKPFQSSVVAASGKLIGLAAVAATAASAISSVLDVASETAGAVRFARSIDVASESVQRLEFAGREVGTSVGAIRGALVGLEQAARGAASGLDEGAIEAFALLGVNVENAAGSLKKADRLLLDVADRVAGASDPAFARTVAEQLGLGTDLNLLLRLGADGIQDLGREADRLGVILGGDAQKASEEFAKKLDRVKTLGQSMILEFGLPLLEWTNDALQAFQDFRTSEFGDTVFRTIGSGVEFLWERLKLLAEPFKVIVALFDEFGSALEDAFGFELPGLDDLTRKLKQMVLLFDPLVRGMGALNELRVFFERGDSLLEPFLREHGIDPDALRAFARRGASGLITAPGDLIDSAAVSLSGIVGAGPPSPGGGAAPVVAGGAVTQNVEIRIDGAQSAQSVARTVRETLEDMLRETLPNISTKFVK